MLLWTIHPHDLVFNQMDEGRGGTTEEVSMGGRIFICTRLPDGQRRIQRMISSDPSDYTEQKWMPGEIL